jgi:hypothetical protein
MVKVSPAAKQAAGFHVLLARPSLSCSSLMYPRTAYAGYTQKMKCGFPEGAEKAWIWGAKRPWNPQIYCLTPMGRMPPCIGLPNLGNRSEVES